MTSLNDKDWIPGPSNLNTKSISPGNCIIHCTDDNSDLVSLQSLDSWKVLLNAATTRQHEGVLNIASSLPDGVVPDIKYHRKCRSTFTMKKLLNNIKEQKKNKVAKPMRKSKRQGSCDSNNGEVSSILPRKCIFCNSVKYIKGSRTREKLSSCMQIRADEKVRNVANGKNDTTVMAIASDDLISKEACYHASCYRAYTKPHHHHHQSKEEEIDSEYSEIWKFLGDLFNSPQVVLFKRLQTMVDTISGRKNLRRKIESKTDCYKFINVGKDLLIYPTSLKMDDIVTKYHQISLQLQKLQNMGSEQKCVSESARIIRKEIKSVQYRMPWPPNPKDLEVSSFKNSIHLDSFLNQLLSSDEGDVSDRVARLKLSFGQDLTYAVHDGHLLTPKSILFPLQIKDLTNNYELIASTNKLGHGVSYSVLQELLTEVAYNKTENLKENEVALPDICMKEKLTILVEDNIDRLEETLSGHGTTHKVNSIIIQPANTDNVTDQVTEHLDEILVSPPAKRKRRSFKPARIQLPDYIVGKRVGPQKAQLYDDTFARDLLLADQSTLYAMWVMLRKINLPFQIPSWTGFYINLHHNKPIIHSNVGYLDCLDAPATAMSTIYYMMERSLRIKNQLNLTSIVCVYDQAIYAKAYHIKCKEHEKFKDLFLMMGTFHIILTYLAVIASRFKDAGLRDVLVQSAIVAEGSVDTMFSGSRAYKRAIRIYKILYEAFSRILLDDFELVYALEQDRVVQLLDGIDESYDFNELLESNELQEYCTNLITYKDNLAERSALSKFWLTFLEMIEVLFNFIYATRAGKWNLYLETIRSALPWFFAHDRQNYSRYLTAHYYDLLHLEESHPEIYTEFQNGNFSVQLSEKNPFGRMEMDKVIETTINKDTKTPGGTTGFSTNHGAVQRWTLTAAYRAQARSNLEEFLSYRVNTTHHDLLPSRIRRDQSDVQAAQETLMSVFIPPFSEMELVGLSSGLLPSEHIKKDLLEAELNGEQELQKFIEERLVNQTVDFYHPIKRLHLGTFASMKKTVKVQTNNKVVQFSAQSDIFGKISLIQQNRKIDLKDVFSYPLGPVPWTLATSNGELMKTSKSKLMHELEKGNTAVDRVPIPFSPIFDGMALVRKFKCTGLTYNEFADDLLKYAISSSSGAKRVDIVFDVYRENSIKNAERGHRSTGTLQFKTILGSSQIKQWSAFLSNGNNKTELIRFLVKRWQSKSSFMGDVKLYVAYDEKCVCIEADSSNEFVEDLECSQEEADTRMLLHAQHICQSTENVLIHTPDTDVLLIAITASIQISGNLFIRTGTGINVRIISVEKVKQSMMHRYDLQNIELLSKSLLSLHAFTGCDTVSAFCGKGKLKPLKIMLKNPKYVEEFAAIGNSPDTSDEQLEVLEKFTCDIYGHKGDSTNLLRYKLYSSRQGKLEAKSIPPCLDSLQLHSLRATYQSHIWRNCLIAKPEIPTPIGNGWEVDEDNSICIKWNNVKPAPDEILELMFCTCPRKCVGDSCPCVVNGLPCTDACVKQDCENYVCHDTGYDDYESDSSSSDDED